MSVHVFAETEKIFFVEVCWPGLGNITASQILLAFIFSPFAINPYSLLVMKVPFKIKISNFLITIPISSYYTALQLTIQRKGLKSWRMMVLYLKDDGIVYQ